MIARVSLITGIISDGVTPLGGTVAALMAGDCTTIRHALLIVGPKIPNVSIVFGDNLVLPNHVRTLLLPRAILAGTRIPTRLWAAGKVGCVKRHRNPPCSLSVHSAHLLYRCLLLAGQV